MSFRFYESSPSAKTSLRAGAGCKDRVLLRPGETWFRLNKTGLQRRGLAPRRVSEGRADKTDDLWLSICAHRFKSVALFSHSLTFVICLICTLLRLMIAKICFVIALSLNLRNHSFAIHRIKGCFDNSFHIDL